MEFVGGGVVPAQMGVQICYRFADDGLLYGGPKHHERRWLVRRTELFGVTLSRQGCIGRGQQLAKANTEIPWES
jgi:hypothetical protein